MEYKNLAVIYMFTSPSGKSYIGQSIDFKARFSIYKRKKKNSIGRKFYNAIIKYNGIENFKLTILDSFEINENKTEVKFILSNLEIKYIKLHNTYKKGYNLTIGGETGLGAKWTLEQRKNQSESQKKRVRELIAERIEVQCFSCKKLFNKRIRILKYNKMGLHFCGKQCLFIYTQGSTFESKRYIDIPLDKLLEAINKSKNVIECSNLLNIDRGTLYSRLRKNNLMYLFLEKRKERQLKKKFKNRCFSGTQKTF
jgi:group I intron endonuclease